MTKKEALRAAILVRALDGLAKLEKFLSGPRNFAADDLVLSIAAGIFNESSTSHECVDIHLDIQTARSVLSECRGHIESSLHALGVTP